MTSRYPLESLLRPPVEFYSVLAASTGVLMALLAPWAFLLTPTVAHVAAALMGLVALHRARQGWLILRYRRYLRHVPDYRLPADKIPVSHRVLFLGRGFQWTQVHTQRLADTLKPYARHYVQPGAVYRFARRKEIAWERTVLLKHLAWLMSRHAWWNPVAPRPDLGGNPALHGVEPGEGNIHLPLGERVGHILILGTTRVGKTRLAEILITQDIHRGDVVIVFDPKGDADLFKRMWTEARRAGREQRFYFFHLGFPEISARYNAVGEFERITEVATRITNPLPAQGNAAAFKEFAWRFANIVARALVALGKRPDYNQILAHITDIEPLFVDFARYHLSHIAPRGWTQAVAAEAASLRERSTPPVGFHGRGMEAVALYRYLQDNAIHEPVLDGLVSAFKYDKTYFDKLVSSLGPLMEKLTSGKVAQLLTPDYFDIDDPRPIFDWEQVIRQGAIVYVGLDALSDNTVAGALGNAMFADLTAIAGRLYKHGRHVGLPELDDPRLDKARQPKVSLYADEFNELIGDEFIPLINKAGGADFQVSALTQTWSDVEARLQDRAKAGQVAGNFNTLIMMRVLEKDTAAMLTGKLREVEVNALMSRSVETDSSTPGASVDFTSTNMTGLATQKVGLLSEADIVELPKGQAFCLIQGRLIKLRVPLPDTRRDALMPADLASAAAEMARTYNTGTYWWSDLHEAQHG